MTMTEVTNAIRSFTEAFEAHVAARQKAVAHLFAFMAQLTGPPVIHFPREHADPQEPWRW